LTFNY